MTKPTRFFFYFCNRTLILVMLLLLSVITFAVNAQEQDRVRQDRLLPDNITVTGNPATASHIRYVISRYLEFSGYSVDALKNVQGLKTLRPGESLTVNVPLVKDTLSVTPGAAPVAAADDIDGSKTQATAAGKVSNACIEGEKTINVKNVTVPPLTSMMLAFSNHPEKISSPGLLYEVGVLQNKPVRLRYYHLGEKSSKPRYLGIFTMNNSSKPAKMHIVESVGGPSKDWILAGHMNNFKFFQSKENNLGWVENIPPESVHLIRRVYIKPGEVVSATADLHLLEGSPVQLLVYAYDKPGDEITYPLKRDEKDTHVRGAYPLTKIVTDSAFSLSQNEDIHAIGDTSFQDILRGKDFRGNYGVMYEYRFLLRNPYDNERSVSFFFQPRGGIATGTFSIDKRTVSVGLTKAFEMVRLMRITVPPRSTRMVNLETMPEDASNYPVRIILMTDKDDQ